VGLCDLPNVLRKFVIVLECGYYKFGCFVDVFGCDLMGGMEVTSQPLRLL